MADHLWAFPFTHNHEHTTYTRTHRNTCVYIQKVFYCLELWQSGKITSAGVLALLGVDMSFVRVCEYLSVHLYVFTLCGCASLCMSPKYHLAPSLPSPSAIASAIVVQATYLTRCTWHDSFARVKWLINAEGIALSRTLKDLSFDFPTCAVMTDAEVCACACVLCVCVCVYVCVHMCVY